MRSMIMAFIAMTLMGIVPAAADDASLCPQGTTTQLLIEDQVCLAGIPAIAPFPRMGLAWSLSEENFDDTCRAHMRAVQDVEDQCIKTRSFFVPVVGKSYRVLVVKRKN